MTHEFTPVDTNKMAYDTLSAQKPDLLDTIRQSLEAGTTGEAK